MKTFLVTILLNIGFISIQITFENENPITNETMNLIKFSET